MTVGHPALWIHATNCPPEPRLPPGIRISSLTQFPAMPGHDTYYLPPIITGDIPTSKDGMGVEARFVNLNQHPGLLGIAGRVIVDSRGSNQGYRRVHHVSLVQREQIQVVLVYLVQDVLARGKHIVSFSKAVGHVDRIVHLLV